MAPTQVPQPQIGKEFILLDHEYQCGDLLLDLFGEFDADGYNVCDVSLSGMRVSLFDLIPAATLKQMTDRCNEDLPSWNEHKRELAYPAADHATQEMRDAMCVMPAFPSFARTAA